METRLKLSKTRLQADVLDVSTSMGDIEIQDSIFQVANLYCDMGKVAVDGKCRTCSQLSNNI